MKEVADSAASFFFQVQRASSLFECVELSDPERGEFRDRRGSDEGDLISLTGPGQHIGPLLASGGLDFSSCPELF